MKREEFVKKLLAEGYECWGGTTKYEVYGKILYQERVVYADGEYWKVYEDHAVKEYSTNRSVMGWSLCEACGEWYRWEDEERHGGCQKEVVWFD